MCPLSAMMQFLTILVGLLLLCQYAFAQKDCRFTLKPTKLEITMYEKQAVEYFVEECDLSNLQLRFSVDNEHVASPDVKEIMIKNDRGNFSLTGNFLGRANVSVILGRKGSPPKETQAKFVEIAVVRAKRVLDTVFTSSVATLVSIIYINFGCAINWGELRTSLKRPFGPIIGVIGQFLFMPLLSFGVGKLLFPDNPEMQLGMFFTGVSPGGGASNVWVAVLDGNIHLSITMTTISTIGAFAMMPLWIFTLGKLIFDDGNIEVPYTKIATYAIALVVPLFIGYLIQRFFKKVARFFVRILKGFSSLLILFIIIFAIVANLYLFELFSWQIVVAGMGLPWLGYLTAYMLAKVCRQSPSDALTIAVETGIQNTGIAIFLLRFTLPQPEGDLTTVVPVAVAIMTPFPLILLFLYQKIRARCSKSKEKIELLSSNHLSDTDVDNNVDVLNKNGSTDAKGPSQNI